MQVSEGKRVILEATPSTARVGNADSARQGQPLKKNLYKQQPEVETMPEASVKAWLAERQIAVEGSLLRPIQQFSHSGSFLFQKSCLGCLTVFDTFRFALPAACR